MVAKQENIGLSEEETKAATEFSWYAIHTKPAREDWVVANISRMGLEAFSPKINAHRRVWGMEKQISTPLFPCYVFSRLSYTCMYSIRYVRGARRIVGIGDTPVPIEEGIIETIRSRSVKSSGQTMVAEIKPGERVMINRGALYGLEGQFLEALSGNERVVVLLKTIEWQARVQVEKSALQKCHNG
jgi:transcriptional antiterminator RfaH